MRNNRIFIVLLGAVLLLVVGATLWQVTATSQVVSAAAEEASLAAGPGGEIRAGDRAQSSSPSAVVARPPSYRSHMGQCYDVPLQEAGSCLASAAESATGDPRFSGPGPDECFDVSIGETCER
jgi:Flp pilus assembly protein TadG